MSDADAEVGGMRVSRDLELARPVELVVEARVVSFRARRFLALPPPPRHIRPDAAVRSSQTGVPASLSATFAAAADDPAHGARGDDAHKRR
jgi:hypothetical protein